VFPEKVEAGIFIQLVICRKLQEILIRAGHNAGDQRVYYNLGCQCNKTLLVVIFLFRITFHLFKAAQITFAHDRNQNLSDFPAHCFSRHCSASQCIFQIVMPLCNFICLFYYKALKRPRLMTILHFEILIEDFTVIGASILIAVCQLRVVHHSPKGVIGQVQATVTVAIFQTCCHTDTLKIVLKSVQWLFQPFFADFVTVMVFLIKWRFRNFHGAARHHDLVQLPLARMTKRCMSQIVSKRNSLGQVFIQAQSLRNRTRNLSNLQRVG